MSRRLLLLPAALAAGTILAGCGTAAQTPSTPAAAAPTSTSTTAQAQPATAAATAGLGTFNPRLLEAGPSSGKVPGIIAAGTHTKTPMSKLSSSPPAKTPASGSAQTSSGSSSSPSSSGSAPSAPTVETVTVPGPTIVKTVAPDVPVGAWLPSTRPPLALTSFMVSGGNIGCVINDGSVRCDIAHRVWTVPAQPASCHLAWGQGIWVGGNYPATFVCAADSVLNPSRDVVPAGDDDVVGTVTCQVRTLGVTCFTADGHGFFLSRTGYTMF